MKQPCRARFRRRKELQTKWSLLPGVVLLACLGACAPLGSTTSAPQVMSAQTGQRLHQRSWDLEGMTIEGRQIVMDVDATVTIRFDPAGQVGGLAGVNRYTGTYSLSAEGRLRWGAPGFATTRRAGPPELMEKERVYLQALRKVEVAILAGPTLLLQSDDASTVLSFRETGR